jgi:adenylylsulfate kinase-like enzyme
MTEDSAVVIVINGPIASGKSSVARAVALEFEGRGQSAACIDLDLVDEMLGNPLARKDYDSKWALAAPRQR